VLETRFSSLVREHDFMVLGSVKGSVVGLCPRIDVAELFQSTIGLSTLSDGRPMTDGVGVVSVFAEKIAWC